MRLTGCKGTPTQLISSGRTNHRFGGSPRRPHCDEPNNALRLSLPTWLSSLPLKKSMVMFEIFVVFCRLARVGWSRNAYRSLLRTYCISVPALRNRKYCAKANQCLEPGIFHLQAQHLTCSPRLPLFLEPGPIPIHNQSSAVIKRASWKTRKLIFVLATKNNKEKC
jgi:hypothetical protein